MQDLDGYRGALAAVRVERDGVLRDIRPVRVVRGRLRNGRGRRDLRAAGLLRVPAREVVRGVGHFRQAERTERGVRRVCLLRRRRRSAVRVERHLVGDLAPARVVRLVAVGLGVLGDLRAAGLGREPAHEREAGLRRRRQRAEGLSLRDLHGDRIARSAVRIERDLPLAGIGFLHEAGGVREAGGHEQGRDVVLLAGRDVDFLEQRAVLERILADERHGRGDRHLAQDVAVLERMGADGLYAFAHHDRFEAIAIMERMVADDLDAARYRDLRKGIAIVERPVAESRHRRRYRDTLKVGAFLERARPDGRHGVWNLHGLKAAAVEGARREGRHRVRNRHAGQAGAAVERIAADGRDGLAAERRRDRQRAGRRRLDARSLGVLVELCAAAHDLVVPVPAVDIVAVCGAVVAVRLAQIGRAASEGLRAKGALQGIRQGGELQMGAVPERIVADTRYNVVDTYGREVGAAIERIGADTGHVDHPERHGRKTRAGERIISKARDAGRDPQIPEGAAAVERGIPDRADRVSAEGGGHREGSSRLRRDGGRQGVAVLENRLAAHDLVVERVAVKHLGETLLASDRAHAVRDLLVRQGRRTVEHVRLVDLAEHGARQGCRGESGAVPERLASELLDDVGDRDARQACARRKRARTDVRHRRRRQNRKARHETALERTVADGDDRIGPQFGRNRERPGRRIVLDPGYLNSIRADDPVKPHAGTVIVCPLVVDLQRGRAESKDLVFIDFSIEASRQIGGRKTGTVHERPIPEGRHACRNPDGLKLGAIEECMLANRLQNAARREV